MDFKKIAAFTLIGVAGYDLAFGTNPNAALPVLGDYLTQTIDVTMIAIGAVILIWF